MAPINTKIGVSGKQQRIGKCFGRPHAACVGEAHGHIGVFLQELQHGLQVIVLVENYEHGTAL